MPFWRKHKKDSEKVNYKARLEHKQYLAQESPEPTYDLTDCGLRAVPSGVYSRFKIMRKHTLLLQDNELSSLGGGGSLSDLTENLQILDLQSNCLEKLPTEIGLLKHLQILYLQRNRLKRLPDSIGDLKRLQSLNVSYNCLKQLPISIGDCASLKILELSGNPKLLSLPKELCRARGLETLTLDDDGISYPSKDIRSGGGTEAVMKFLCKESDIEYIPPSEYTPPPLENGNGVHPLILDPYESIVEENLKIIEKQKEEKNEQMKALEKVILDNQEREKIMAVDYENTRKKFLESMAEEEARGDEKIKMVQSFKAQEQETLNKSLHDAEKCTDTLITELVHVMNNDRLSNPQKFIEEMEAEKREMEDLFTIKAGEEEELRQKDVLSAMQRVMEEEMKREQLRSQYEAGRQHIISSALLKDSDADEAIKGVLQSKGKQQQELVSDLLKDEEYQRSAFSTLYMKQDSRTQEISNRLEQVQSELASLTMVEMTKRDMKVEFEQEMMSEKRETLTKMLVQLMDQKEERAKVLQDRLEEIETRKETDQDNYWLIQYQKLLDSKPKALSLAEEKVDRELKAVLTNAGAEDYLSLIAQTGLNLKQIAFMSDKELSEIGIHDAYLRQKIAVYADDFISAQGRLAKKTEEVQDEVTPSAPPDEDTPSAPPDPDAAEPSRTVPVESFQSTECVICLENKCDILFLPCGHVCSCWRCESTLEDCPLCRTRVTQKVRLR